MIPLLALALTTGTLLPPPPMPNAVKADKVSERENAYRGCLYYGSLAWVKNHTPEGDPRDIAKIAMYSCDKSLQKLAMAMAIGLPNPNQAAIAYIAKLRSDDGHALAIVFDMLAQRDEAAIAARAQAGVDTTAEPHNK